MMCFTKRLSHCNNLWLVLVICNTSLASSIDIKPSLNVTTIANFTDDASPVFEGDIFNVNTTLEMSPEELKEFNRTGASVALYAVDKNVTVIHTRVPGCNIVNSRATISCSPEYDAYKIFLTFEVSEIYGNQIFQIIVYYKNTYFYGERLRSPLIYSKNYFDSALFENVNLEIFDEKGEIITAQKKILKNYRIIIVSNMTVRGLQMKTLDKVEIDMSESNSIEWHMFTYLRLWACNGLNDKTLSCVIYKNTITIKLIVQASKELSEKIVRFKLQSNGTNVYMNSVRLPKTEDESVTFNNKSLNNDTHNIIQEGESITFNNKSLNNATHNIIQLDTYVSENLALILTIFGACLVVVVVMILLACWCLHKKNICSSLHQKALRARRYFLKKFALPTNPDPEWV